MEALSWSLAKAAEYRGGTPPLSLRNRLPLNGFSLLRSRIGLGSGYASYAPTRLCVTGYVLAFASGHAGYAGYTLFMAEKE